MKFACSDLIPGDHVVWPGGDNSCRLEVIIMHVDHVNYTMTHLCILNEHRPEQVGEFYTTPKSSKTSWECEWENAEIVSRAE